MSVSLITPKRGRDRKARSVALGEAPDDIVEPKSYGIVIVYLHGHEFDRIPLHKRRITIGRGRMNDIRLNNLYVSIRHAVISANAGKVYVHDLHSLNKTSVNGVVVPKSVLNDGDVIEIGGFVLRYQAEPVDTMRRFPSPEAIVDADCSIDIESPSLEHGSTVALDSPVTVSEPGSARSALPEIEQDVLQAAVAESARQDRHPLQLLAEMTGAEESALVTELGRIFTYPVLSARELMRIALNFSHFSPADARQRGCLIGESAGGLLACIWDPFDSDIRPWLEARVRDPLQWRIVSRGDLNACLSRYEQSMRAIDSALASAGESRRVEVSLEDLSMASVNRDSSPVVKLVRSTLFDALRANASDIHLESGTGELNIRYRIDGVLVHVACVSGADMAEQVISRIKVMSDLDIAERRIPQDGRFKCGFDGRQIDFRVSIMPSTFGEDGVLRVLDKQAITDQMSDLRIDGLGFDDDVVEALRPLARLPHGMLLVTGPTGSGKTTTLYAAISETNTGIGKIVTIEDPVEYQLHGVLQIPVNEKKGLTFARGLRSILRHDPDKIMVGEIRDPETAQIAVQSALTGHLVFTTVHANNVFDVLSRFEHMGVDVYSFVAALNGILAQRLVRVVCGACSESFEPSAAQLDAAGLPGSELASFEWRIGRGCSECRGTGFRGRKAVGELLVLNDELREAITSRAPVRQLKELAHKNNFRFIRSAALDLVRSGLTTIEEVNRVISLS